MLAAETKREWYLSVLPAGQGKIEDFHKATFTTFFSFLKLY